MVALYDICVRCHRYGLGVIGWSFESFAVIFDRFGAYTFRPVRALLSTMIHLFSYNSPPSSSHLLPFDAFIFLVCALHPFFFFFFLFAIRCYDDVP